MHIQEVRVCCERVDSFFFLSPGGSNTNSFSAEAQKAPPTPPHARALSGALSLIYVRALSLLLISIHAVPEHSNIPTVYGSAHGRWRARSAVRGHACALAARR